MTNPTAIILAGGKSSRMGQDKGLMLIDGKAMVKHVIDAVLPLTKQIIIITNNEEYNQFGYPIYNDLIPEKGPLVGIITGLTKSKSDRNWILSCDTPFVSTELLSSLMDEMKGESILLTRAFNNIHPLIGTYKQSALNVLVEQLTLNNLKLLVALKATDLEYFNANHFDERIFKNINSPKDL